MWSRKTENCVLSVHTESAHLMRMAAEEPNTTNLTTVQADPSTPDDGTEDEINVQVGAAFTWHSLRTKRWTLSGSWT